MHTDAMQMISIGGALVWAGCGSVHDLRERRIPNWLTGAGIVAGLGLHAVIGGTHGLLDSAAAGLIAGVLSGVFWVAGGLGAGDVKMLAAVGCLAGLPPLHLVLISIATCGAVFAIAVSLYHRRLGETLANVAAVLKHHRRNGLVPHAELNLDNPNGLRLPFALPIAAGCLLAMCLAAWETHV